MLSSLLARMASILRRSEAEHRDWEMVTRSEGSGMTRAGCGDLGEAEASTWEQARWNDETAMQDRCLGWACNREENY